MSEFGIVLPQKAEVVRHEASNHLEDLPGYANTVIGDLLSEHHSPGRAGQAIRRPHRSHDQRLHRRAAVDATHGRRPIHGHRDCGDGGQRCRVQQRTPVRRLLVLGARAMLNAAAAKTDSLSHWAVKLAERRGYWTAVVAIAAKNARMAWAVLTKGESFKLPA